MAAPADLESEQRLRESYRKHAARAQLHRLCGTGVAPDAIRSGAFEVTDDGVNFAIATSGGEMWRGAMRQGADFLPELVTGNASGGGSPSAEHRIRSTIHFFIALVENPARDPEPFLRLLAEVFSLHYTPEPLRDAAAIRNWVTGRLSSVVASEHDIHRITCRALADGCYSAELAMKSQALFPDGSGAISRNIQHWTLHDDPTEPFPRITEILIARDAVEFFGPPPEYAPRAMPG